MKIPRTKLLFSLIAGLVASSADAVNLSTDGTGQVLLYPYYTTRNGFVTSFTVVNGSTDHTKAVKVRIHEGKSAAPVLLFNLFLPPRDVWTASITNTESGAALSSSDRSCTAPQLPAPPLTVPFTNFYYAGQVTGVLADNAGSTLDRTREGHIEIIEMAVVANGADVASSPSTATGIAIAAATKHTSSGIPANCALMQTNIVYPAPDLLRPAGGLSGNAIIINASTGTEFAYTPVALQRFFRPVDPSADLYALAGDLLPDLSSVSPARSDVLDGEGDPATLTVADWVAAGGQPIDAVSAVLMRSATINEYDVTLNFKTDWIVTEPTKRFYVLGNPMPTSAPGPFQQAFSGAAPNARSCDSVVAFAGDRATAPYPASPSACPTGSSCADITTVIDLCWSSNVVTVAPPGSTVSASSIFSSTSSASVVLPASGVGNPAAPDFRAGWIGLFPTRGASATPNGPGQSVTTATKNPATDSLTAVSTADSLGGLRNLAPVHTDGIARRYRGLPVIGFAAVNAQLSGQGYGGIFTHKYQRNIAP